MQLTRHSCPHCSGKGQKITKLCHQCGGERVVKREHTLAVHIPAGAPEGYEVVYSGEADESPDMEPGDVIVRVRSSPTSGQGWTRKEGGLVGRVTLSVAEVSTSFAEFEEKLTDRPCSGSSATLRRWTTV